MENYVELLRRLLEIQSGGRQRSPKLIAEDERLMDALRKKTLTAKSIPSLEFRPDRRQPFRD